ncbi:MAG: DUF3726 domain-containing protein [Pseudomonadota bacterium]
MTFSLSEVEALSRKATRGAGFSWGIAEEAGKSVRWLCAWGLPGAEALARYLEDRNLAGLPPEGPVDLQASSWTAAPARLCPLATGLAISDYGTRGDSLHQHAVDWPILMLPQIAWPGQVCSLSWMDTLISWDGVLRISGAVMTPCADLVTLSPGVASLGQPCPRASRANPMPQALHVLTHFAARTYAPETDASKRKGAGAGLVDRD